MSVPFKSSPVEFNQHLLFPTNIFDLLSQDHEYFLYAELFQQLDTSSLESLYSVKGQNAYHPKLIVAILIFAYSQWARLSHKSLTCLSINSRVETESAKFSMAA